MGTNYYIGCKHCKSEIIHIGKQSVGWSFNSNFSKEELIKKLKEMFKEKECYVILSEYGDVISEQKFWDSIVIEGWRITKGEFC